MVKLAILAYREVDYMINRAILVYGGGRTVCLI